MLILKGHKDPVQSVSYSSDGRSLLSIDRMDVVKVWNLATGECRWSIEMGYFSSVTFTPDGLHVLTSDEAGDSINDRQGRLRSDFDRAHPVQLRDTLTGAVSPAPLQEDHTRGLYDLRFSPDGSRCVARKGRDTADLQWWSYPSGEPLSPWKAVVNHELNDYKALAFSPDGRMLAGMNFNGPSVFDVPSGRLLFSHPFKTTQDESRLAWHPDGDRLAVGSGTRMAILDIESRKEKVEFKLSKKFFQQAVFSRDGKRLMTVSNEETVKIWDAGTGQLLDERAWQVGGLRCLAISPDGLTAVAAGMKKHIVVWDLE